MKEITYTPQFRKGSSLFEAIKSLVDDIRKNSNLLVVYSKREFVASYRKSAFGILWNIITPLIPISVYLLLQVAGILVSSTDIPRAIYVSFGITFWGLFADGTQIVMNRLDSEKNLISKVKVPLVIIYLSAIWKVFFDFIVRLVVSFTVLVLSGYSIRLSWLNIFPHTILIITLSLSIGILLSFIATYIKDVKSIVAIFFRYGIFASGVIFPIAGTGIFSKLIKLNPFYYLINDIRHSIVFGGFTSPEMFFYLILSAILLFFYSVKKLYTMEYFLTEG